MSSIDRLLEDYSNKIGEYMALARSIVADHAEAEDVLQDVMLNLLSDPARLDSVKNIHAFLRTCVRNEAIDHVRRLGRTSPTSDELLETLRAASSEEEFKQIENLMWIRSYADKLPDDMREAFVRYTVDGHRIADIARDMGIPPDTLRKRFNVIKKRMRSDLTVFTMIYLCLGR